MLRNKLALLGLVILIGSVIVALAAPLLTPYDPQQSVVSGTNAQPQWVMNFPDGYYLSQNIVVVDNPQFSSPSAVQAWTVNGSSTTLSSLRESYAPGVSSPGGSGSIQLAYTGAGPGSVVLTRSFNYPYHGPPEHFIGSAFVKASGASIAQPVSVRLFINRIGDQAFNLWNGNITSDGQWFTSSYSLDSNDPGLRSFLGFAQESSLSPAQIIFSARQQYSFGLELKFNGPQQVNVSNLQLQLYGTAWGLLGTDYQGKDIFSQLIYGSRISLTVGFVAAFIGIGLGLLVGLVAGLIGSLVDQALMRFTDMMLVIPGLPLLLVLVAVLGQSLFNIIIVIGFLGWPGFARVIRAQVLTLKERPFVEAARAAGAGPGRIMFNHIFPNIVSLTYVNLAIAVPGAILTEAALEFLGLGDPSVQSWGIMFFYAENSGSLFQWWWVLPPGIAIALVSVSFVFIGYALDEIFNPKLRRRR